MNKKRETKEEVVSQQNKNLEEKILENLVELQKVHANLAEKFDKLAGQISNLLVLFESAARSFAENPANQFAEKDKEFLEKVDKLLEQNKTIAKGLMLVEERIRERVYGKSQRSDESNEYIASSLTRPLPKI